MEEPPATKVQQMGVDVAEAVGGALERGEEDAGGAVEEHDGVAAGDFLISRRNDPLRGQPGPAQSGYKHH